ncbi:MAG: hydantoinase B/oxoprolinase family protein [Chthonomonadales bacterium]
MQTFDALNVQLWQQIIRSIPEEMGVALERTAFSPNIRERRDHSCAIFLADGKMFSQAAHIPVHLGAMPLMMESLLEKIDWRPGDMWLCNDPAHGGTHLPDFTLIAPIFSGSDRIGFVANRAHHADIGGMSPGSLPLSTEIYQEGLILPPVRLVRGNRVDPDILAIIRANSRTGDERIGDSKAQVSSNRLGQKLFQRLYEDWGTEVWTSRCTQLFAHSKAILEQEINKCVHGTYTFEDYLDDDGQGNLDIPIRVALTVGNAKLTFDFAGSAPQVDGSLNCTLAVTRSACYYLARCLIEADVSTNAGLLECVDAIVPEGSILNADPRAAVSAGNVETSQRIVDVIFGAMAQCLPDRIPAASQGTMNNLLIGGWDPHRNRSFSYYETICGGAGASAEMSGESAIQIHMTNTLNTPIEVLESHYPVRLRQVAIRRGSGGKGTHNGGDGIERTLELTADAVVTIISERRTRRPYGLIGAIGGSMGSNSLTIPDGGRKAMPGKFSRALKAGTIIEIQTPGGGGWGKSD